MATDVLSAIHDRLRTFSKGQKLIAGFILQSYDKAAFMTASKLGKTVGVSESTVVRFAVELGFDGYPSMQKTLQEIVRNKLTSVQRIEAANDRIGNQDVVSTVLQADIDTLRRTSETLDRREMDTSVDAILAARHIYIVGVGREDVVIGISLPRYSSRTIKAMQYARDCGATTISITDKHDAPAGKIADHVLVAKSDMVSIVDSLVAPMSVVNALIVAVSRKREEEVSKTFKDLERLWDEYDVYERVE